MNRRDLLMRIAGGLLIVVALAWFAYVNSGEQVDVDFGLFAIRSVSLSLVIYGAIVVGMVFMLAVSLRGDVRTGKALERYDQIAADVLRDIEEDGESVEREVVKKEAEKT
ncbi:MAG: hypothetical protein GWN99_17120 [Gemmatimonadetes bacterium]|uniref:DUF1049 domain-containing protein n=1 Tax=Candidatus Kutchimonas denitrificans TaxID=3056748 RepID=A0AAE4Z743_9BACT|nr:hypothetical protein [Gemmatimonadota bacterium]NIR74569.1 hypothetical protein [Candidatus Kutchimonas denitrificans]NIS02759.1 hypothetical protein [Gemmatimonadota bacterium]NIT68920.1 hypothetical protein [Gemmatimonadota bacterium]NIU52225.1 hypothetical protein [Gemmatimonadota bacterium]